MRAACVAALLGLGGCGFAPLYGESTKGVETQAALSQVQVAPIGQRLLGLQVRNALLDRINPDGEPAAPAYRLEVTLRPSIGGTLVQPDASITRYQYTLSAQYKLIGLDKSQVLTTGSLVMRTAYNVVDSEYATLVSRQDAERRAAESLSSDLALRLAVFFKGRAS